MNTQGARLREIRQQLRLSQDKFGEVIGVSKQYVSNLEANRNLLNNEKLVSLLVDHNVNINYLLAGVGDMFINDTTDELSPEMEKAFDTFLKKKGLI